MNESASQQLADTSRRWGLWLAATLLLPCLSGCGSRLPPVADPDRAAAALKTALEAWQQGASTESLAAASPPIHVSDVEWASGSKLTKYQIKSEQAAGLGWRCEVLLTVQRKDGRTKQYPASYRIDTDPAIVVVHEN